MWTAHLAACLVLGRRPGVARRASNFLLLRQKKVTKEKATPSLRPLRGAKGQTCVVSVAGCAVELTALRCSVVQTSTASQFTKHGRFDAHAHPTTAPPQVCPFAPRRGRRLGVAFSLVTFFWRSKRKLLACRATPGSRTHHGHAVATAQKHRQAQPERMGWCPGFDKLSPNGSGKTREL